MKNKSVLAIILVIVMFGSGCNTVETLIPSNSSQISVVPISSIITSQSIKETPSPSLDPSATPIPSLVPIENPTVNDLYEYLQIYLSTYQGDYGMYFYNLDTNESFGIRDKEKYIAASTSKVPINLYLYKLVAEGKVDLDTEVEYLEEDLEWGTGKIIKEEFGVKYSLRELSKLSIEISDNCAINMIIRTVGKENFINYMNSLGAIVDYHTYRTCPYDMYLYFDELYKLYNENTEVYSDLMIWDRHTK